MRRGDLIPFLAAGLCVAIGAAACGSGGGSSDATATGGATAAAAPTSAAATTTAPAGGAFTLSSPAFADNAAIPRKFTCQGEGVSPELDWTGVPAGTTTLALLVVDPDAQIDNGFTHWVLTDIDPAGGTLAEGTTAGTPGGLEPREPRLHRPVPAERDAPLRLHAVRPGGAARGRHPRGDRGGRTRRPREGRADRHLPADVNEPCPAQLNREPPYDSAEWPVIRTTTRPSTDCSGR